MKCSVVQPNAVPEQRGDCDAADSKQRRVFLGGYGLQMMLRGDRGFDRAISCQPREKIKP